jgi:hypothetical protein
MCRGMQYRNIKFQKVMHQEVKEPIDNDPEELGLDIDDEPNKNDNLSDTKINSSPKVITPNS